MKKLIIILFLSSIVYAQYLPVNRGEPLKVTVATTGVFYYTMWSYQRFDYRAHLAVGYTASTITGYCLRNKKRSIRILATLGSGLIIGTGKELYDKYIQKTYFNKHDFLYTLTGTGIGILITI
jgi:hypothetical protein